MADAAVALPQVNAAPPITERAVALALSFHRPYFTRQADDGLIDVEDAEKDAYRLSKDIIKSEEYQAIVQHDGQTYRQVRDWALPYWFRRGTYLFAAPMVERVERYLRHRLVGRGWLIAVFLTAYPARKEDARVRFGEHFDEAEYPSVEALCEQFGVEWDYLAFNAPAALEEIDADLFRRQRERIEAKVEENVDTITHALCAGVKKMVDHWVVVLAGDDDGKVKRFKADSLPKLREFLADVQLKNTVVDNAQLTALVQRAQAVIEDADADGLRKDDAFRGEVLAAFAAVQSGVDQLIENKPKRRIKFA